MEKPPASPLAAALANLKNPAAADAADKAVRFPIPGQIHVQRQKDILKDKQRRLAKRFIRASNADTLIRAFPKEEGDSTHAYVPGDFIFGDLLTRAVEAFGPPRSIDLSTLSLSESNVRALESLILRHRIPVTLALSTYFQQTNKDIFTALQSRCIPLPGFSLAIGRIHSKIMLLDYPEPPAPSRNHPGGPLIIETSANLRSADCIESVTIHCSRPLHEWHRTFLHEFARVASLGEHRDFVQYGTPPSLLLTVKPAAFPTDARASATTTLPAA